MPPFRRPERIPLLTALVPRIRWRYCRHCARHFITFTKRRRTLDPAG